MKVFNGKVVGGKVELPPGAVPDGETVTVLVPEGDGTFSLTPDQEVELQKSIDQASRGEVIDGWDLLAKLRG